MGCTLIENGYLIPMNKNEVVADGAVAFEGTRIIYVGATKGFDRQKHRPDTIINARGKAILPGLINTHIHLVGAYMKGLTEDVPGSGDTAGLYKRGFPVVCSLADEDYYSGCMTHALEMIMSGTTTISSTFLNERLVGPVAKDLGIRAVLSEWIVGTDLLKLSARNMERPWDQSLVEKGLDAAQELFENWHGKADGRITTRISPGGPGYLSDKGIEQTRDLAKKHGVGINIHIAEVPGETEFVLARYGKRPMELGRDLGILTPETIGFHCVFLNDSDIEIMHETGMNLSHTAFHTPKRGYFPPMEKVHKRGVSVSIGSDWCSNDLWKFIRSSILFPRVKTGDVSLMEGYDALRLATVGGARALGMEKDIGTLEVGKKADIILLDLTLPWYRPIRIENLISNIVYNSNGSDVTDVFVDGVRVVSDRAVTTVDAEAIMQDCQSRAERVWGVVSKNW
ncbi:MAG: amidohydrolase family protein [Afipia sp.]|nr:amidohydrolase family protein [Afipia sp.]